MLTAQLDPGNSANKSSGMISQQSVGRKERSAVLKKYCVRNLKQFLAETSLHALKYVGDDKISFWERSVYSYFDPDAYFPQAILHLQIVFSLFVFCGPYNNRKPNIEYIRQVE